MGRQMRFFIHSDDHSSLLKFAELKGFRAVPQIIVSDTIPELHPPSKYRNNVALNEEFFYLLPATFAAAEAFYIELPSDPGLSKLMTRSSPVIEVSPSKVEENQIGEGRIYINNDTSDPRHDEALKSYKSLERYVRKWPKTNDGKFHVGPQVANLCNSGKAKLWHGGKELKVV